MIDLGSFQPFIQQGEIPLTPAQFERRKLRRLERVFPPAKQAELLTTQPALAAQIGQAMSVILAASEKANAFNHDLAAYRAAVARLAKYRLAEGVPEIMEMMPTGETDEDGFDITEDIVTQVGIDPLDPEIQQDIRDPETGEITGVEWVPNPEIVKDDAERAAAQAVIDNAPQEVIDFAAA